VQQLQLQLYELAWNPAAQPRPQVDIDEQVQSVQSPHWQEELQVRLWHVPHPSELVAPIAHTGVPCSSQPSDRLPLQSE